MQLRLTVEVWQRGNWFIAKSPELDFVAQGRTADEARQNLLEVVQIQFSEMRELGTLQDYLAECGYSVEDGSLTPQLEFVSFEKRELQVA